MKRLIISVLMLMAATFIFSQRNSEDNKVGSQQDLIVHQESKINKF